MWLGILVLSVALLDMTEAGGYTCPGDMVYMECGSACNITCDDADTNFIKPCTLQCVRRCQCPSDRPVQDITYDGSIRCITGDMCCPEGKVWNDCAPSCPPECNPVPKPCTLECQFRCTCPRDKPIETSDGRCISEDQCPLKCPKPYVFMECGSACNRTCDDPNPVCTLQCVRRCQCPHKRPIQDGNKCVTEEFCKCGHDKKWRAVVKRKGGTPCMRRNNKGCTCKQLWKKDPFLLKKVCKRDIEGGRKACCKLCKKYGFY